MRDTPPSIQDGSFGLEPAGVSHFDLDDDDARDVLSPETAEKLAREAYESSTDWLNASRRAKWSDSLRAFNSQHPQGSKYRSREYQGRSTMYRPMSRTMVRKGEATTAAAFFSNEDVLSMQAENDDDPNQQASAEILKALLQYRLTTTIPWFLTLVGGRQDAEVMGIAIAKTYWKYEERFVGTKIRPKLDPTYEMPMLDEDEDVQTETYDHHEVVKDEPAIDLINPENFRFDPSADWRDPVRTSAYVIELIPMYHQDVLVRIESGEWNNVSSSALFGSSLDDTTRNEREDGRNPDDMNAPEAYETVWVRSNILRYSGQDWQFFSLEGSGELLSDPLPLEEVFLHGERPYVVGCINLEAHKNYPASKIELTKDLQRIANDDLNLRFDAMKMSLNPRQFVKAGAALELNDLRTMVPGKVIMVRGEKGEPLNSVMAWDRPPEPGQSAYQEQQLNQLDWDALTGSFNNASVQASQFSQQSATGMHLLSGEASGVTEYELRIFAETFVEPILRQLVKLEQAYETDDVILGIAASKAQLFQRWGHDKVTDHLLNGSVTIRMNVGIGATNPSMKMRAFQQAAQTLETIFGNPIAAQGLQFHEVLKEVFANAGYRDGERFIKPGFDPAQAMQAMEQAKQQGKGGDTDQSRIQAAQIQAQSRIQEAQIHASIEQKKLDQEIQKAQLQQQNENWRTKYQEDQAAWGAGVPQQAQGIQDAMSNFIPALQAMHQSAIAGQQHMAQHAAVLKHLTDSHQQLAASHAHLAQQFQQAHVQNHRHLSHLAAQITAPKRIVRDASGKVAGVETVPPTNI